MRTPRFWSEETVVAKALALFSPVYGWIAARRRHVSPYRPPVPVMCVGNVTAGGSGKTPAALTLARMALERGIAVHFLSRGYGGSLTGPIRVDPLRHGAAETGDEPFLLAQVAPAWVSRDRAAGARAAVAAGAGLIIMDDGLQNFSVTKDVALLVIDGGSGIGNGRLLPAGPLREPLQAALSRADAVLLIGEDVTGIGKKLPSEMPVIPARLTPKPHSLKGQRAIAFAGIGRPEKFRDTLLAEGIEIVEWVPFADHHRFTAGELARLADKARAGQALLVTTEKDHVRLPAAMRALVHPFAVELVCGDDGALLRLIDKAMSWRNPA
jgi:tetraacyldisaccharide 4'-kinase